MKEDDWISVETNLPDGGQKKYGIDVLAVILHYFISGHQTRIIRIVTFKDGLWWHSPTVNIGEKMYQKVTHWAYLPDMPPKHKPYPSKKLNHV